MKDKLLFFCLILLLTTFSFVGCNQRERIEKVDFKDAIELKEIENAKMPALNVCVGSMITPEEGHEYYKRLLDYLGRKLDLKINFMEKKTYAEVNLLLKKGNIDVAFVCGGPYVEGHDEFGLELLVAPVIDGKTEYFSYIIVNKNSGIEDLEGLRGKRFGFVDPMSNTGKLIPTYLIQKEFKQDPKDFFKEYLYTYDHDKSIKAVAYGIIDGAAVDSLVWDYMDKKGSKYTKETRIIKTSEPYGIPPVVVRLGLDLAPKIKEILLNMHRDKEGADILKGMFIDKFVKVDDSNYDGIRRIKARMKKTESDSLQ